MDDYNFNRPRWYPTWHKHGPGWYASTYWDVIREWGRWHCLFYCGKRYEPQSFRTAKEAKRFIEAKYAPYYRCSPE